MYEKEKNILLDTILRLNSLKKIILKFSLGKQKILGIGGFDGYVLEKIKINRPKSSFYALGMDKKGLEIAKKKGLNMISSSVTKIFVKSKTFVLVLCLDLIENVKEDSIMVAEIFCVIKKRGILILTFLFKEGFTFPFLSKLHTEKINLFWGHVRKGHSYLDLKNLFRKNGLKIIERSKYFNFLTRFVYRIINFSKVPIIEKKLIYQKAISLEQHSKFGGQEHIIVAEEI